ncbi:MAG: DUF362 domain-containing protein [Candidatus Latescibacteria bacterium]|nr:DUF362 domain-containing protein [Candidatus Latescibacterota bacterium]
MKRRNFLHKSAVAGATYAGLELYGHAMPMPAEAFGTGGGIDVAEGLDILEQGKEKNIIVDIRPEIRNNPRAVFLIETHVSARRDDRGFFTEAQPQLEATGKDIASQIFIKGSKKGGSTIVRPNFTTVPENVLSPVCGINTSCDFIAGFIQGLREMGNTNVITSARGTTVKNHRQTGIYDVFDKHNINLIEANYRRFENYDKTELNWHKVPGNPQVWKNIPTYRPIGDKDNFFINMPKLKNHNLGLTTLSIKNLQGVVPRGYGHYCDRWSAMELLATKSYDINFKRDFVKDYYQNVESAFLKHRAAGFKHWDYENVYPVYEKKGGWEAFKKVKDNRENLRDFMDDIKGPLMWDEQWSQRAIDSAFAIRPDINIIEGIIGRDGSGFNVGTDELCNVLVIGISIAEVDSIGSYIMGHDPTELPYTRIARERGLGECDPNKIDLYWIKDGEVISIKNLTEIKRHRLGVNMHTWAETSERLFW